MSDPILAIDWRSRFVALAAAQEEARRTSWQRCNHDAWTLVRVFRGEKESIRKWCETCKSLFDPLVSKSKVQSLEALRVVDGAKCDENRSTQWQLEAGNRAATERDGFFELYTRYLKSPVWQGRRALVLNRAQGTCEGCLRRPATMVHHLTYAHVGDELLFELRAICATCHEKCHEDHE